MEAGRRSSPCSWRRWPGRGGSSATSCRRARRRSSLSLFLYTPLAALFSWTQLGVGSFRFSALPARRRAAGRRQAVGLRAQRARPGARAGGAAGDRAGAGSRASARPPARRRAHRTARPLILAAAASLLASWLHPWQGITLILIFVGLAVLRRLRDWRRAGGARRSAPALPLAYYYLLSHHDPAWKLAGHYEVIPRLPALVLLAGFGPLALIAALRRAAARRRADRAGAAAVDRRLLRHLLRQRLLRPARPPGPELPVRRPGRARLAAAAPARPSLGVRSAARRCSRSRVWPTTRASSSAPPTAPSSCSTTSPSSDAQALDWVDRARAAPAACSPRPRSPPSCPSQTGRRGVGRPRLLEPGLPGAGARRPTACSAAGCRRPRPAPSSPPPAPDPRLRLPPPRRPHAAPGVRCWARCTGSDAPASTC